jgi:hypothetical protein
MRRWDLPEPVSLAHALTETLLAGTHSLSFPVAIVRPSLLGACASWPALGYIGTGAGVTAAPVVTAGMHFVRSACVAFCSRGGFGTESKKGRGCRKREREREGKREIQPSRAHQTMSYFLCDHPCGVHAHYGLPWAVSGPAPGSLQRLSSQQVCHVVCV